MHAAQRLARRELPRRFYTSATAEASAGGYVLKLDGRSAKTPAKRPLAVGSRALAEAMAAEWNGVGEIIDPGAMPLTRIVNSAIDRVAGEMSTVSADIVSYAGSDLLCYRAEGPDALTARQEQAWGPLIAWAREALGARFALAEGIVHTAQNPQALAAIARAIEPFDALELAALHTITTLTGSAILALAVARQRLSATEAWTAAHVDEDWQMAQWGVDEIAVARRGERWKEMQAAALILETVRG